MGRLALNNKSSAYFNFKRHSIFEDLDIRLKKKTPSEEFSFEI